MMKRILVALMLLASASARADYTEGGRAFVLRPASSWLGGTARRGLWSDSGNSNIPKWHEGAGVSRRVLLDTMVSGYGTLKMGPDLLGSGNDFSNWVNYKPADPLATSWLHWIGQFAGSGCSGGGTNNHGVAFGFNISGGGGLQETGPFKGAIASAYEQCFGDAFMERHELYVDPTGVQHRPISYLANLYAPYDTNLMIYPTNGTFQGAEGTGAYVTVGPTQAQLSDPTGGQKVYLDNAGNFINFAEGGSIVNKKVSVASSGTQILNAPKLALQATYWNGSTAVGTNMYFGHDIDTTSPMTSHFLLQFDGVEPLWITNTGRLAVYNNEVTAGVGVAYEEKVGQDIASSGAGAQNTTIAFFSPQVSGLYRVSIVISCTTADTVSAQVTYTDAVNTTNQTLTPISSASCGTNGTVSSMSVVRANTSQGIVAKISQSSQTSTKASAAIERLN